MTTSCSKRWRYPPAPFSFDSIYVIGTDELVIEFYEVDITNCPFILQVMNITSGDVKPLNPKIATLVEPVLITDTLDPNLIVVSDYASLII